MVLRQIETGTKIGGTITILQRCQWYYSLMTFLMMLATFYYTTLRHVFPIHFFLFLLAMFSSLLALAVFEYTVIYPSVVAFQVTQAYKRNPLVKDVLELKKMVEELSREVEELKRLVESGRRCE